MSSYPRKGSEQDEEEIPIVTVALVLLLVRFAIVSITPVTVCRSEHKEQEKRMMEVFPVTSQQQEEDGNGYRVLGGFRLIFLILCATGVSYWNYHNSQNSSICQISMKCG